MTAATDLLTDAIDRIREVSRRTVAGLGEKQLTARIDSESNTIGWLVWHLARGQDAQVAQIAGLAEVWTTEGWERTFALPFAPTETGYAHSSAEVAAVKGVSAELLTGYLDAVSARTQKYLATLTDVDLADIVDENWTPPVTRGARLISIISDDLQHAGQAAYIRGVLERADE